MKLAINVPCMDMIHTDFATCLNNLAKPEYYYIQFWKGSLIYDSRNILAHRSVEMAADHVLWLDSDMYFDPDLYFRLAENLTPDVDISTAVYFTKYKNPSPVIYKQIPLPGEKKEVVGVLDMYDDYPKDSVFPVEGCGFGACLMRPSLFVAMHERYDDCFLPLPWCGEDLAFCSRAKEMGAKIVADSRIRVGHIGAHCYFGNVLPE